MEQKKGGFISNRILDIFEEVSCGKWYRKRAIRQKRAKSLQLG
jgi:hypothetical protein